MPTEQIWMSWHLSRRSRTFSDHLNIPLVAVQYESNIFARQLKSGVWSIVMLARLRPRVVFLQYSFFLLTILAAYKTLAPFPVRLICDCHTKALRRSINGKWKHLFQVLKKWSLASADTIVLSNVGQIADLKDFSNNYIIVPDFIPGLKEEGHEQRSLPYCVISMSFDKDEPLTEIAESAEIVSEYQQVFITGTAPDWYHKKFANNANVKLTGYISDNSYISLLTNASCIVSLTNEEGCLQCTGYEALALGRPFVTSDTSALRSYFGSAAVFVRHNRRAIAEGITDASSRSRHYRAQMAKLKQEKIALQRTNTHLLRRLSA